MLQDLEKEEAKAAKKKRRKRRKKKLAAKFNQSNPWQSSSGSSSTENEHEEEEEEEIESDGDQLVFKSDHEFSPESDLEKDDESATPLRRARTAQKTKVTEQDDECVEEAADAVDEYACQKCSKVDHPEWILLCDGCDKGWHCSCLRPALMLIPEGDWYCPPCQHNNLVMKLQESLKSLDVLTKKHQNELLRKKRLAYVGISLDNVLHKAEVDSQKDSRASSQEDDDDDGSSAMGSSSEESSDETSTDESEPVYQLRERRCANTYKFNEYDDMINAAIQDEVDAVRVSLYHFRDYTLLCDRYH
jgi:remodeling and spacing factor 1